MEEAARRIDADVVWLGHGPDDPVHDFGFSKNGDDTLRCWGEERIVERLVRAYRTYRPDIVIPTFLDVPGQHGHHRAMTRAAEAAFDRAADPNAFPEQFKEGLRLWQVSKLYLPAWSGAGYAYDDEVPPPPTTLTVHIPGPDQVTGLAYRQIGEWSRAAHASQGMGIWQDNPSDCWALHLKRIAGGPGGNEGGIQDRLPATLSDLAAEPGVDSQSGKALREAQDYFNLAKAAFPDRQRITVSLSKAAQLVETVRSNLGADAASRLDHRLDRKLRELDAVIFEANAHGVRAAFEGKCHPGARIELNVRVDAPAIEDLKVVPRLPDHVTDTRMSDSAQQFRFGIVLPASAPLTGNYPDSFDSMGRNGEAGVRITGSVHGLAISVELDPEEPFKIEPAHSVVVAPETVILRSDAPTESFEVHVAGGQEIGWRAAEGWRIEEKTGSRYLFHPPHEPQTGLATHLPLCGAQPASTIHHIAYSHIQDASFVAPAALRVLTLDVVLPTGARIGYVGAGSDKAGLHMRRLGLDVTDLREADLANGDLSEFTTIVVGIFAFGRRPDLQAATDRLHAFVETGGHLVTLYHRPTDGWSPDRTPPRRLTIGSPSLRWRVTDPRSDVRILTPDHPLLTYPNRIGPADWQGWDKERGLYFAAEYDSAYEALISLNDPGEPPLAGALVSGQIGRGRHTHVALVLHHQMDRLVPGAFRLLANLVQPA
jgi:LmbE family N-acetylglucosaminyl deacetylase